MRNKRPDTRKAKTFYKRSDSMEDKDSEDSRMTEVKVVDETQ